VTVEAVILRYQQRYGALRAATVRRVEAAWRQFGGLDDAAADRFVAAVVPIVETAEVSTARLLAAYLQALAVQATGSSPNLTIDPAAVSQPTRCTAARSLPPARRRATGTRST
jgi:hypothetical protein